MSAPTAPSPPRTEPVSQWEDKHVRCVRAVLIAWLPGQHEAVEVLTQEAGRKYAEALHARRIRLSDHGPWLRRVAKNLANDLLRAKHPHTSLDLIGDIPSPLPPDPEVRKVVAGLVDDLPPEEQAVIRGLYYSKPKLKVEELALSLGVCERTVHDRRRAALSRLRERLDQRGYDHACLPAALLLGPPALAPKATATASGMAWGPTLAVLVATLIAGVGYAAGQLPTTAPAVAQAAEPADDRIALDISPFAFEKTFDRTTDTKTGAGFVIGENGAKYHVEDGRALVTEAVAQPAALADGTPGWSVTVRLDAAASYKVRSYPLGVGAMDQVSTPRDLWSSATVTLCGTLGDLRLLSVRPDQPADEATGMVLDAAAEVLRQKVAATLPQTGD